MSGPEHAAPASAGAVTGDKQARTWARPASGIERLALTAEDVADPTLPGFPASDKRSDSRYPLVCASLRRPVLGGGRLVACDPSRAQRASDPRLARRRHLGARCRSAGAGVHHDNGGRLALDFDDAGLTADPAAPEAARACGSGSAPARPPSASASPATTSMPRATGAAPRLHAEPARPPDEPRGDRPPRARLRARQLHRPRRPVRGRARGRRAPAADPVHAGGRRHAGARATPGRRPRALRCLHAGHPQRPGRLPRGLDGHPLREPGPPAGGLRARAPAPGRRWSWSTTTRAATPSRAAKTCA
jgi:hypothetical protein